MIPNFFFMHLCCVCISLEVFCFIFLECDVKLVDGFGL